MKVKMLFLVLTIILGKVSVFGQNVLLPIDSLYVDNIDEFYSNANEFKDNAWEGMTLSPVCIFRINGPAFLYKHPNPPKSFKRITEDLYQGTQAELQLFGATQVEINGVLTAIIDYGLPNYSGPDEIFAELFHETHHVYQRNDIEGINFDNPATLMTYPENYRNDALKIAEQKLLYSLCFCDNDEEFKSGLNRVFSIRRMREEIIDKKYFEYEKDVESLEGPAYYCQLLYYKEYAKADYVVKQNFIEKELFGDLNTPYYGREELRNRHLASGLAMCLILDKYENDWKKEYYTSGEKLYDFFISRFKPEKVDFSVDCAISKFHTQNLIEDHKKNYNGFMNQKGVKITLEYQNTPQFRGFDPMHAEAINDSTVLHTTFLKLQGAGDNQLFISNKEVITYYTEQIWFVDELVIFVNEEDFELIENNVISIKTDNISIRWKGTLKNKTESEIVFICE